MSISKETKSAVLPGSALLPASSPLRLWGRAVRSQLCSPGPQVSSAAGPGGKGSPRVLHVRRALPSQRPWWPPQGHGRLPQTDS